VDFRSPTHANFTSLCGVNLRDVVKVSSDSDLTAFAEVTLLKEAHQAIGVVEGVDQVSAIFGGSADYGYTQELVVFELYDLSIEDATGNGESVELSVAR
jgi:hypothetical protein